MARDLWARLQSMYLVVVKSRAMRKPAPHALDPRAAAQALAASVRGLITAATSPYVIDKFLKCGCWRSIASSIQTQCFKIPALNTNALRSQSENMYSS